MPLLKPKEVQQPPPVEEVTAAAEKSEEFFSSAEAKPVPQTADQKVGTIDVVWYTGAAVPRVDRETGEPYMLTLDMSGCRMERLNAGAPIFDTHFSGDDMKSMMAGAVGTRAVRGVVQKAWADGAAGKATLKFDLGDPDGADMFRKASTGILQNLSFGTWIYKREKTTAQDDVSGASEIESFTATDWEPFEISPVTVPADFNTCFLSAENGGVTEVVRATSPEEQTMPESINNAGETARTEELAAVRAEAQLLEKGRIEGINLAVSQGKKKGWNISEEFAAKLISEDLTVQAARERIWDEFVVKNSQNTTEGENHIVHPETAQVTRDQRDTRREQMEAALLVRYDPQSYGKLAELGHSFRGMTLVEMARECLRFSGARVDGMVPADIAGEALKGRMVKMQAGLPTEHFAAEYFDTVGAQSTSDFPAILANVLNKTLRQAYEAYPQTFKPFSRQTTAKDFKPIQRTMLHDVVALQSLNSSGEYHRAQLSDSKVTYSLATFGEIVALTRKVIINDDLQAFTRVPALLGFAAARLESDTVWAVMTGTSAAIYPGDTTSTNLFAAGHSNLNTSAALALDKLETGREKMRLQTGPNGTYLNLVPRYLIVPAHLESTALTLIAPMNLAVTAVTAGVPEWVRSLTPIVEPRLDANLNTTWYLAADNSSIDTLEYCYLEGQQGVYVETRQGFEVDGLEVKARMDFAAAAIDYRGLQRNTA